jgi:prepilin-type N-terminal cleavage/methylation domain-containing protein
MKNGFTIIELIVVIAIIAVLSSIVATSVTKYISKSKDSAIKENMNSFLINSLTYLENHGNFGAFCNDPVTQKIYNAITSGNKYCHHNDTQWVVCMRLYEVITKAWCVDSTSTKKEINDSECKNGLSVCP